MSKGVLAGASIAQTSSTAAPGGLGSIGGSQSAPSWYGAVAAPPGGLQAIFGTGLSDPKTWSWIGFGLAAGYILGFHLYFRRVLI